MNQPEKPADDAKIACDICLKEIPASGAQSDETADYVAHFCGLDCYKQWQEQQQEQQED